VETVLLLGLGPTTRSALESLTARFQVAGLIRDGDDEVVEAARALGVPVLCDPGIERVERAVTETGPDCVVVSSYNRILPARLLALCRFVNVHYAPLPQYRGRANVNWAIINGEPETAITIHVLAPGLDAGNILYQQRVPIGPDDTVGDLYAKLNDVQRQVLGDTVVRHLDGYEGEPQDEASATYGCTRVPDDGEIDWSAPTRQTYALVRALGPPYPGAHTYLGGRRLAVLRASLPANAPRYAGRIPGRVVGRSRQDGHVDVLTGDGMLRIHEVATAGSGAVPASAVIASTRQTLGLRTADLLARIETLESHLDVELVDPGGGGRRDGAVSGS
jgi:methionyl-tRNA formyltransferase